MGWTFPWASSSGSDFNADFNASFTEEQQREGGIEYNYRREPAWQLRSDEGMASRMPGTPVGDNAAMTGTDPATYTRERPGMSAFVLEAVAYFAVWTVFGMVAYLLGVALPPAVPLAVGVVMLMAGVLQFTAWKARHLACCREAGRGHVPADAGAAWRHGLSLGLHCA